MTFQKLLHCLEQTQLSPEKLAPYFSVSNMTLRRWEAKASQSIPEAEIENILNGIFALMADGHLSMESKQVQSFVEHNFKSSSYFNSVMKTLGLTTKIESQSDFDDKILGSLGDIGVQSEKRKYVESQLKLLPGYLENVGRELSQRTMYLVNIVRSARMSQQQKLVAYGALFYLFLPFDLIPDHIPVFGYLDDFAVVGFAMAYYQSFEMKKPKSLKSSPGANAYV